MTKPVLKVQDLAVAYKVRGGEIEAVQNVSFEIGRGESYGIVGESGCGKSTMAWAVLNFLPHRGWCLLPSPSRSSCRDYERQGSILPASAIPTQKPN